MVPDGFLSNFANGYQQWHHHWCRFHSIKSTLYIYSFFYTGRLDSMSPLIENIGRTTFCLQYPFEGSPFCTSKTAEIILPVIKNHYLWNIFCQQRGGIFDSYTYGMIILGFPPKIVLNTVKVKLWYW